MNVQMRAASSRLDPRVPGPSPTDRRRRHRPASLILRNILFTIVVPGLGGVAGPWYTLAGSGGVHSPTAWSALGPMVAGTLLYLWGVGVFAAVGRGTPGYWDSPRNFVVAGPYRWVRNPIYIAALLIVGGEAWLFMSLPLLKYAVGMAIVFEVFVIGYEEPHLRRKFGSEYVAYKHHVRRWLPLPPHPPATTPGSAIPQSKGARGGNRNDRDASPSGRPAHAARSHPDGR